MNAEHQYPWLHRRLFWDVKGWHLLTFVGFYFIFGFIYWLTLFANVSFEWNPFGQTVISYTIKSLFSVPVYWLVFVKMKKCPLRWRLCIHLFTMPVYVVSCFFMFRVVCDAFGYGYMKGAGAVWDIYIPFLLYFVQFGFLHFYEYVSRAERLRQKEQELRQLALQSEVNALKAQIQPHFLFNTLNSISASVPPEMERTRELIAQLADTFRFGLQASQSERVSLRDEIRFLQTYLQLEKQRFGERLNMEFRVGVGLLDELVPPMLLQPLVENVVKHGVGQSLEPVTVTVAADRVGKELKFSVSDTGPGLNGKGLDRVFYGKGIGIRNTKLRLEKVFGKKLKVRKNEPQGLVFEFEIPT